MKLNLWRRKDQVHLLDMIDIGLIDLVGIQLVDDRGKRPRHFFVVDNTLPDLVRRRLAADPVSAPAPRQAAHNR